MAESSSKPSFTNTAIFRNGIERVLSSWTALKLAVEHGTGGPNSRELAKNFIQYIGDIFCDGGELEIEDISDILIEVMDTQFETWCEDNSPIEIAALLCKLFILYKLEKVDEMMLEIERLPECHETSSRELPNQSQGLQKPASSSPLATLQENLDTAEDACDNEVEAESGEPGWTRVTSRRRHVP